MTNLAVIISAMILVESSGNDLAVSVKGACGPLQIRHIYVEDVNRITGRRYTDADTFDRTKSIEMLLCYWAKYGKECSVESMLGAHYRGPRLKDDKLGRRYAARVLQATKLVKDEDVAWTTKTIEKLDIPYVRALIADSGGKSIHLEPVQSAGRSWIMRLRKFMLG